MVDQHGKSDLNGQQVWNLARALERAHPIDATHNSLLAAVTKSDLGNPALVDGWGRPLTVNVWRDAANGFHYEVVSFGRDGRAGPCSVSQPGCQTIDADWIVIDGKFAASRARP